MPLTASETVSNRVLGTKSPKAPAVARFPPRSLRTELRKVPKGEIATEAHSGLDGNA